MAAMIKRCAAMFFMIGMLAVLNLPALAQDGVTAAAGDDKTIIVGEVPAFDACASTGAIVNYRWVILDAPDHVPGDDGKVIREIMPDCSFDLENEMLFSDVGTWLLELEVTDEAGNIDSDTVEVTVNPVLMADAGDDQTIPVGEAPTFDACASTGAIVNYRWVIVDAPPNLPDDDGKVIRETLSDCAFALGDEMLLDEVGMWLIELEVTDEAGGIDSDFVAMTVVAGSDDPAAETTPEATPEMTDEAA
ncbi:MAG: hypothetical protein GYB67_09570 [Chloroflexi bacterium]|nr:hypothetical protein [Chloroflexota bacterium]